MTRALPWRVGDAAERVPTSWRRWSRPLVVSLAVVLGAAALVLNAFRFVHLAEDGYLGADYRIYVVFAHRWLDTGSMYLPFQLTGPYDGHLPGPAEGLSSLYPPIAILLFVPFVVLPAVLWWAIPVALTGYGIIRWRPRLWFWPAFAALLLLDCHRMAPIRMGKQ